jgi:hypothetical protein
MAAHLPAGWPDGVHPPGSERFEQTAVAWLFDVVPPDYRVHGVLQRHPVALASLARHHVAACVAGARDGYRVARAELGRQLPPAGLDAVLAAYRSEGSRLVATGQAVELIERALRGQSFTPRLGGASDASRDAAASPATASSPAGAASPTAARSPAATASPTAASSPAGAASPTAASSPAATASPTAASSPAGAASPTAASSPAAAASPDADRHVTSRQTPRRKAAGRSR